MTMLDDDNEQIHVIRPEPQPGQTVIRRTNIIPAPPKPAPAVNPPQRANAVTTTLSDGASKLLEQRRVDARAMYRELALRANAPRPGDAKLLADVLTTLELTPEDFQRDCGALAADEIDRAEIVTQDAIAKLEHSTAATIAQAHEDTIAEIVKYLRAMNPFFLIPFLRRQPGSSCVACEELERLITVAELNLKNTKSHNAQLAQQIIDRRRVHPLVLGEES